MKYLVSFVLALFLTSCGGYNTTVVQKSEKGFFKFIGNLDRVKIIIDDGASFSPEKEKDQVFQVKPGKHEIKIYRDEQLIVNRVIVIDNQTTTEVEIP